VGAGVVDAVAHRRARSGREARHPQELGLVRVRRDRRGLHRPGGGGRPRATAEEHRPRAQQCQQAAVSRPSHHLHAAPPVGIEGDSSTEAIRRARY
jgi:hypothetical protein